MLLVQHSVECTKLRPCLCRYHSQTDYAQKLQYIGSREITLRYSTYLRCTSCRYTTAYSASCNQLASRYRSHLLGFCVSGRLDSDALPKRCPAHLFLSMTKTLHWTACFNKQMIPRHAASVWIMRFKESRHVVTELSNESQKYARANLQPLQASTHPRKPE